MGGFPSYPSVFTSIFYPSSISYLLVYGSLKAGLHNHTKCRPIDSHTKYCHRKLLTQKQIEEFLNLLVLAYRPMCGSLSADRSR